MMATADDGDAPKKSAMAAVAAAGNNEGSLMVFGDATSAIRSIEWFNLSLGRRSGRSTAEPVRELACDVVDVREERCVDLFIRKPGHGPAATS
jgi:hypothetical protein